MNLFRNLFKKRSSPALTGHRPEGNTLLIGPPGSLKTTLLEQFLTKEIKQGSGLYYVGSMPVWRAHHFTGNRPLIDLDQPDQSLRINPMPWTSLNDRGDAHELATLLFHNLNGPETQEGDFFVNTAINYVASMIWYLRTVSRQNMGRRVPQAGDDVCTLPHLIELARRPYGRVISLLASLPELAQDMHGLKELILTDYALQLEGLLSFVTIMFAGFSTPQYYWILAPEQESANSDLRPPPCFPPDCLFVRGNVHSYSHRPIKALYANWILRSMQHTRQDTGPDRAIFLDSLQNYSLPALPVRLVVCRSDRFRVYAGVDHLLPHTRRFDREFVFWFAVFQTVLIGRQLLEEEAEAIAASRTFNGLLDAADLLRLDYDQYIGWLKTDIQQGKLITDHIPVDYSSLTDAISEEAGFTDAMLEHAARIQQQIQALFTDQ